MNRGNPEDKQLSKELEEHDDNFSSIVDLSIEENYKKEDRVVLWDADSLIYHCLYSGKDELGNKNPEYTDADLEMLQGKLSEMVLKVLNNIEKYYNILSCYIFIKGKNNFRKEIFSDYKANRPEPSPLNQKLYDYIKIAHGAIESDSCEAEDMVYTLSKKIDHNGIIVYVDHDLEEIPSIFYNYQKNKWSKINEKEAIYNKYKKLCLSEPGDNVKTSPGIGKAYYQKNFNIDFNEAQYEKALYQAYVKAWKGNKTKAAEMLRLAKKLLLLKDMS